jgi:hypothetical protein
MHEVFDIQAAQHWLKLAQKLDFCIQSNVTVSSAPASNHSRVAGRAGAKKAATEQSDANQQRRRIL